VLSDPIKAIDCDVHPAVPGMDALKPFLEPYWLEQVESRGIDSLETISYPPNSPLSVRPDWRKEDSRGAVKPATLRPVLDRQAATHAILNCIYGVHLPYNEDAARAFARALNDWIAKEWLDADDRLYASIVVPLQNVEYAVDEIERRAKDKRFVQVLVPAMGENLLGKRRFWPIYAAAERHGLPLGIHAGSAYRHPVTSLGWPSYYIEDYSAQSTGFQAQVASLITEGVFTKFPGLKVVLIESGVTWAPGFLWRLTKFWRGMRSEVPWVDRPPWEVFRDHIRMTIQPLDAPETPDIVARAIEHLHSDDILLYSSDFPHWQFDGDDPVPAGVPDGLKRKIMVDNPVATYFPERRAQ